MRKKNNNFISLDVNLYPKEMWGRHLIISQLTITNPLNLFPVEQHLMKNHTSFYIE